MFAVCKFSDLEEFPERVAQPLQRLRVAWDREIDDLIKRRSKDGTAMLNLYTIKRVAEILDIPLDDLVNVAENTRDYVVEKTIYDPTRLDREKHPEK